MNCTGITPHRYNRQSTSSPITYDFINSPFGNLLLAAAPQGICGLSFLRDDNKELALSELTAQWPLSPVAYDPMALERYVVHLNNFFSLQQTQLSITLFLKGTIFQQNVWKSMFRVPLGEQISYADLAGLLGKPTAFRAVANALSRNPIAILIPCHRVVRSNGLLGGYKWGIERKKTLLDWEKTFLALPSTP